MSEKGWTVIALGLVAAALAWPAVAGALHTMTLTPYERALQASWCGGPLHDAFALLNHCAVCWLGSAALMLLALIVACQPARRASTVHATAPYSRHR